MASATSPNGPSDELFDCPPDGSARLVRHFIPLERATDLLAELPNELDFQEREIVLFGKRVKQPRLVAWAGDVPYRYSGVTLAPRAPGPLVRQLLQEVVQTTRVPFNHVLANFYRDGNDSMGLHSDSEPELGESPTVASLSLGATRRFRIVPRDATTGRRLELDLTSGSLLVMQGALQHHYRHDLPKSRLVREPRLNLTFRRIVR